MKSDFRATKSLAADLMRIEESINENRTKLNEKFKDIKLSSNSLNRNAEIDAGQTKENLYGKTSALRDIIEILEDNMLSIEGIDLFDFNTSPDVLIASLRKLKEYSRSLDSKIENNIKLLIKAKGNGELKEEIDLSSQEISTELVSAEDYVSKISNSLESLVEEIDHFKIHSRELLQQKIL